MEWIKTLYCKIEFLLYRKTVRTSISFGQHGIYWAYDHHDALFESSHSSSHQQPARMFSLNELNLQGPERPWHVRGEICLNVRSCNGEHTYIITQSYSVYAEYGDAVHLLVSGCGISSGESLKVTFTLACFAAHQFLSCLDCTGGASY